MAVPQKMQDYCNELTQKLMTESFPKEGKISGKGILSFSPLKQLNLFIVKNLLIEWQREIEKLESPYFDFECEDVKNGLTEFANLLSRNILVSKNDFAPLVYRSALETITLLTSPYEFYVSMAQEATEQNYSLQELESIEKYIKHNKHIFTEFIKELKSDNYSSESYSAIIEGIFKHTEKAPDDPESYIQSLSEIHPFDSDLLSEETEEPVAAQPVEKIPKVSQEKKETVGTYKETRAQVTIHDSLIDNSAKSLADVHQERKIEDIRKSLNLNQKFMFINGLFDGNEDLFNSTIDNIEKMNSIQEAKKLIKENFSWDDEQEEVTEFYELLAKRLP